LAEVGPEVRREKDGVGVKLHEVHNDWLASSKGREGPGGGIGGTSGTTERMTNGRTLGKLHTQ